MVPLGHAHRGGIGIAESDLADPQSLSDLRVVVEHQSQQQERGARSVCLFLPATATHGPPQRASLVSGFVGAASGWELAAISGLRDRLLSSAYPDGRPQGQELLSDAHLSDLV